MSFGSKKKSPLFDDVSVLSENSILVDKKRDTKYKIIDVLGKGGFGIIYKVQRRRDFRKFAIKELFINGKCHRLENGEISAYDTNIFHLFKNKVEEEVVFLSQNSNENIIRIHNSFEFNNTVYMVMEFLVGDDLEKIIRDKTMNFREKEIEDLIRQLANGFKNIHNQGIIHRDIKPNNIVKTSLDTYKLIDFTNIKLFLEADRTTISTLLIGSTFSPIELLGVKKVVEIGAYSDIYSLGMTIYCCVRGTIHVPNASARQVEDSFQEEIENLPINKPFKQLIKKMTAIDGKDRFQSFDEILDYLDDPCLFLIWYKCLWKYSIKKITHFSIPTVTLPSINFGLKDKFNNFLALVIEKIKITKLLFITLLLLAVGNIIAFYTFTDSDASGTLCDTAEKMEVCEERYRDIFSENSTLIENLDEFKALVEGGVSINTITNKAGETALNHLAYKNKYDFVKVLLENGIDVNLKDNKGEIALYEAIVHASKYRVQDYNKPIINLLIEKNSNIYSRRNDKHSILYGAINANSESGNNLHDIIYRLVQNGACDAENLKYYNKNILELKNSKKYKDTYSVLKSGGC